MAFWGVSIDSVCLWQCSGESPTSLRRRLIFGFASVFSIAGMVCLSPASFDRLRWRFLFFFLFFSNNSPGETSWLITWNGIVVSCWDPTSLGVLGWVPTGCSCLMRFYQPWCFGVRSNQPLVFCSEIRPALVCCDGFWLVLVVFRQDPISLGVFQWDLTTCCSFRRVFDQHWSFSKFSSCFYGSLYCVLQTIPTWRRVLEYVLYVFFVCLFLPSWIYIIYMIKLEGEC